MLPMTSQISLNPKFMKVVLYLVLILQQPVDRRLIAHRLADDLGGRLAVDVEKCLVIDSSTSVTEGSSQTE